MSETVVQLPILFQQGKAREINDKLIAEYRICAFINVPDMIIRIPVSSYKAASDSYYSGFYKLYHDYGSSFLMCITNETIDKIVPPRFHNKHINSVYDWRTFLQHGFCEDRIKQNLYRRLRSLFRNAVGFDQQFSDLDTFWHCAEETQWKVVIEDCVKGSNSLFNTLQELADGTRNILVKHIQAAFSNDLLRTYDINTKKYKTISLFASVLDGRMTKILCREAAALLRKSVPNEYMKNVNKQLCSVSADIVPSIITQPDKGGERTPEQMKAEIALRIKRKLSEGLFPNSEEMFGGMVTIFCDVIREQWNAQNSADTIDMFES